MQIQAHGLGRGLHMLLYSHLKQETLLPTENLMSDPSWLRIR